uniref:SPOR domain-containing protein n=1 Tax=Streptomyces sp. NBC_01393 TaxID=2903851 RepID=A0AAU3I2C1_9ACTN
MRALATRPQRLALACALISAATLGTVSASAASASDRSTVTTATAWTAASARLTQHSTTGKPPKGGLPPAGFPGAVGYRPTSHAPGDVNTANDAFAACMRGHGQKVFPAFHASKDKQGRIRFNVQVGATKGFDPNSKSYRAAVKACAPILKKAGITLSSKAGLPPLPVPGKPGKPGTGSGGSSVGGSVGGSGELPGFHTEKGDGKAGAPEEPTLSSVTESV